MENKITISEARRYLSDLFTSEYRSYINTTLAGDFAVALVKKFKQNNKSYKMDTCSDLCVNLNFIPGTAEN